MLLNRMSLRSTAAVGAATLVAGATFAVSAFADDGVDPEIAASAALPVEGEAPADETVEDDFFASSEKPTEEELQALRTQAETERDAALGSRTQTFATEGSDIEEEEPEPPTPTVPAGSAKEIALQLVLDQGWPASEFSDCLEPLWEKESNWNHTAQNPSSGAYGIPQSLPGNKMASHGSDWQTNPATQISWGIDYIKGRYGTPCGAWSHSQSVGWY
ncbi:aggregation-promoting factor C-terminal-like domain-containing protein [Nocardiopsis lambiniae]|uniref:Lytic transglycosylase domain-containing protein n=1 Tax=Nocardiopsis lambiniae TaxID=3075539 RepID=A0ABU2M5L5_9ACTN|nr:lytic transglycosylase domain-containing protein [Nocardiopsis sp. DSM 44743]MDT0327931.1 lytic transglycosylase domain-containing protein [Nocardiopsis sp. DSM 44743]